MPSILTNPLYTPKIASLGFALGIVALITAFAASSLPGRSGAYYSVEGRLFIGGQPAKGAKVRLHRLRADGAYSVAGWATSAADGSFQVSSRLARSGVPRGNYRVTVTWNAPVISGEDYLPGPNIVPKLYSLPSQTPLKIEVAAQNNQLPDWSLPVCDCGG